MSSAFRSESANRAPTATVSLSSDAESDIAPQESLTLASGPLAGESSLGRVTEPKWRWLLAGALVVLALEWVVYNKRVWV